MSSQASPQSKQELNSQSSSSQATQEVSSQASLHSKQEMSSQASSQSTQEMSSQASSQSTQEVSSQASSQSTQQVTSQASSQSTQEMSSQASQNTQLDAIQETEIRRAKDDIQHLMSEGKQKGFAFLTEFSTTEICKFLENEVGKDKLFTMVTTLFIKPQADINAYLDSDGLELRNAVIKYNCSQNMAVQEAEEEIKQLVDKGKEKGFSYMGEFSQTELYHFLQNEIGQARLFPLVLTLFSKPVEGISDFLQSDGVELLNAVVKFRRQGSRPSNTQVEDNAVEMVEEQSEITTEPHNESRNTDDNEDMDDADTGSDTGSSYQNEIKTLKQFLEGATKEIFEGNFGAVKNFLKAQGGISVVRDLGMQQTPLAAAAERGDIEEVKQLLQNGADPNDIHPDDEQRLTPLFMGVVANNEDVVKLLLDYGANVNQSEFCHATPLHYASLRGYKKIVEQLISHGANIHLKDCELNTPAHAARDGLGRYLPAFMRPNPDSRREILDIFEDIIFEETTDIEDFETLDLEFADRQLEEKISERPWISHRRSPLYEEDIRIMTNMFQSLRSSNYFKDSPITTQ